MTAGELFAVVEKVPKAAWPPCRYSTSGEIFENGYGFVHEELAELLFVGSMVKWLAALSAAEPARPGVNIVPPHFHGDHWLVDVENVPPSGEGPTLLAALASATIAAGKGEQP